MFTIVMSTVTDNKVSVARCYYDRVSVTRPEVRRDGNGNRLVPGSTVVCTLPDHNIVSSGEIENIVIPSLVCNCKYSILMAV